MKKKIHELCDEKELPFCMGKAPYLFGLRLFFFVLHCASNESNVQVGMLWHLARSKVGMAYGTWEKFLAALQSPESHNKLRKAASRHAP